MKRAFVCTLSLCLLFCGFFSAFANEVPETSEGNDDTVVRIWVTDGKNLPDTNENNPVLSVRVVDENGNLIPNAVVTLQLVKPVLTDEVLIKSEQNGSTTPTQGNTPAPVQYKVFGPGSPEIEYVARAGAPGYRDGRTNPFTIQFDVNGTIEIILHKSDPDTDVTVNYVIREKDEGTLSFTTATIAKGTAIGRENVPEVFGLPKDWVLVGYFVDGKKYTAQELEKLNVTGNTTIEVRTMPDKNKNGTDDRDEGNVTPAPDTDDEPGDDSHNPPQTGSIGGLRGYAIGFSVSLVLLVIALAFVLYRTAQEKNGSAG